MPELPEVETTRRGLEPHLIGTTIREVVVRRHDLREPVSENLPAAEGRSTISIRRRSKYLIVDLDDGACLLIHLGMSGSLRVIAPSEPWKKHDHVAFTLSSGLQVRYHDPRRFGMVLYLTDGAVGHPLLSKLGPEPLEEDFTVAGLAAVCAKRSVPIKLVIMDAKTVVGVGNIYASEALFHAGILPGTPANTLMKPRLKKLITAIRDVLHASITEGGTTLRDFLKSDGEPGYFKQKLFVYDRKGEPCRRCGSEIQQAVMGQRSTYWCPKCQR